MIYLLIFIFIVFCVYFYDVREASSGRTASFFLLFIILVLLSTLRYRVGTDSLYYEDTYDRMPDLSYFFMYMQYDNELNYQPLWVLLVAIARSVSNDFVFFQFLHSLIFNVVIFYFFKKYTTKPFTALAILFVFLLYFYYSFEILRETMAIVVFLLNIKNLEDKKWIAYYLLATVSFLFHFSAFFLFFLPLFRFIKFNQWLLYVTLLSTLIFIIFRSSVLDLMYTFLIMDAMRSRLDVYSAVEMSTLGFIGYYFIRVIMLIPLFMLNISKNLNEQRFGWFYSSFFLFSVLSQVIFGFDRLLNYLYPVYIIIIVDFIFTHYQEIKSRILRNIIAFTIIIYLFFLFDYRLFIRNEWGQQFSDMYFPYTSVFNPRDIPNRQDYYENQW